MAAPGRRYNNWCRHLPVKKQPDMDYIFFGVVLMHLVAGFGWMIYKLEFSRRKGGKKNQDTP